MAAAGGLSWQRRGLLASAGQGIIPKISRFNPLPISRVLRRPAEPQNIGVAGLKVTVTMLYSTVMNAEDRTFDIDELAALTATPVRTIRFYIQEGLVPRPLGAGRGARYAAAHLESLLAIRRWQEQGLTLGGIRQRLAAPAAEAPPRREPGSVEVWSHIHLRPGIELRIDPTQAGLNPEQLRALARAALEAAHQILDQDKERNQ